MGFTSLKTGLTSNSSFRNKDQELDPISLIENVDSYKEDDLKTNEVFARPFEQLRTIVSSIYKDLSKKGIHVNSRV